MTITFEQAQGDIAKLVKHFHTNCAMYRASDYKEAHARQEFIDPLFVALGWDVHNTQHAAPAYREVVVEASLDVEGSRKAPDYAFRVGREVKFFVEAKKPGVSIKTSAGPAYQLRRYAWSLKLPLSLLTDFEELAVYDCRARPSEKDKASAGRTQFYTFEEYPDRWRELWDVFSRQAVLSGAFDQFAQTAKGKRGTSAVDAEFLKEVEAWRDVLARNIAVRNPRLTVDELNDAVQRTIDRIIFLRMAEDRGMEEYERLHRLAESGDIYAGLIDLCRKADARYNSGLFDFGADKLTPGLAVDDKVLRPILTKLYFPASPYEFSVLPTEILGNVYEQFLGKVIRLTPAHQAKVEEKPEVRKAGGVYYTPTYIVEYIVKNTVGKWIEDNIEADHVAADRDLPLPRTFRVLDMACGSGSFLLGAYQYLLDYYVQWYSGHEPQKYPKAVYAPPSPVDGVGGGDEGWRLTTAEKKRILTTHIFGVDIDRQAVEVTKLSLLLKVLEGESDETLGKQLSLFQERALPNLDANIKCGNSLIGPDYFTGQLLPNPDELRRVNPFDWEREFPPPNPPPHAGEGKGGGSFDCIIGNPPYIRIQVMKEWAPLEVEAYKQLYTAASKGNYDIYVVFVERGLSLLNKRGRLGFILPHKFFNAQYGQPVRDLLAKGKHLAHVVHFGDQQVFAGATTYTCLMFLDKAGSDECEFVKVDDLAAWRATGAAVEGTVPASSVTAAEWNFAVGKGAALFERLSQMPVKLGDVAARMYQGPITSADTIYLFKDFRDGKRKNTTEVFSKELDEWITLESGILKRVIRSGDIHRYAAQSTALVLFPYKVKNCSAQLYSPAEMQNDHPMAWEYLNRNKKLLESREKGKFKDTQWYRFGRTQNLGMWEQPKLMLPYMTTELAAYLDYSDDYYFINVTTGGYGITSDESFGSLAYLCGLLNSRLLDFCFKQMSTTFHGGYFAANKQYIEQLPICPINFSDPADAACHNRMVTLVEQMLELHKQQAAACERDRKLYQRQIAATDREIDQLVYELYDLAPEEIAIVENRGDKP